MKDNDLDFDLAEKWFCKLIKTQPLALGYEDNAVHIPNTILFALAFLKEIQAGTVTNEMEDAGCGEISFDDWAFPETGVEIRNAFRAMTAELMKKVKSDLFADVSEPSEVTKVKEDLG